MVVIRLVIHCTDFNFLVGSLSNHYSNGSENFTLKVNPRCFKLYHAYSISFSSRNVGEFAWS